MKRNLKISEEKEINKLNTVSEFSKNRNYRRFNFLQRTHCSYKVTVFLLLCDELYKSIKKIEKEH